MKSQILTTNFQKALSVVERLAKKNLSLPILDNVLIETEKNFLKLTTTNLEASIVWRILAKIEKEGKGAFPATFLSNLVRLITTQTINLSINNKNLILSTEDQEFQIQGVDPEEFPIVPKIKKKEQIQLYGQDLSQGLAQVIEIPTLSQVRPEISGIYFLIQGKQLKIVATDSFRLAEKTINLPQRPPKEGSFILPQGTTRELLNILSLIDSQVNLFFDPDQVLFEWSREEQGFIEVSLFSRQITGQYPNYKEIIPKETKIEIVLERQPFLNQLKKAGLFSGQTAEVKLSIVLKEKKLRVFSQALNIGKSEGLVKAKDIRGEEKVLSSFEVSFNHKYLEDGLKNSQASEVVLSFIDAEHPCLIRGVGDESYLYILMPIKAH